MSTHDDGMDEEMTPDAAQPAAALPREQDPGRLLEERTVRALRERGLIEAPRAGGRVRRIPRAWLGGAVAAGIALFASGIAMGQWMGTRATAQVVQAVQAQNERQAALLVQQTGSAYVDALGQMAAHLRQRQGGAGGRPRGGHADPARRRRRAGAHRPGRSHRGRRAGRLSARGQCAGGGRGAEAAGGVVLRQVRSSAQVQGARMIATGHLILDT